MLCHGPARGVGELSGGAPRAKHARGPPTERNGTFSFEPAVSSVGTGRKCAFGATTGDLRQVGAESRSKSTNAREARYRRRPAAARPRPGALGCRRGSGATLALWRARREALRGGAATVPPAHCSRAGAFESCQKSKLHFTFSGRGSKFCNKPRDPVRRAARRRTQHHLSQRMLGVSAIWRPSRRVGGSDLVSRPRSPTSDRFERLL